MNKIWLLILEFMKTGLFAVGGGLATIPFLNEIAVRYASTPGPIGINMATYVGYTVAGAGGAVLATLSIVTPSIIVICIIANYFQKFKNARIVQMIFAGLKRILLLVILLAFKKKFPKMHPIAFIVAAAAAGVAFSF